MVTPPSEEHVDVLTQTPSYNGWYSLETAE
jgi:hypothetical protein